MILKILILITTLAALLIISSCQNIQRQDIFKKYEWSENYARDKGVESTSPEVIDGFMSTSGKLAFPASIHSDTIIGSIPSAEVIITLPEKKSIKKIVIHSDALRDFGVLAFIEGENQWKLIKEYKNNSVKEIIVRTSVVTDKVKIRAYGKAKFDGYVYGFAHSDTEFYALQKAKISAPEIREIELYGYK